MAKTSSNSQGPGKGSISGLAAARRPDFLVIGAAKCGTTSLAAYLDAHPDVYMSRPKELRYFSHRWDEGAGWYSSMFEPAPPHAILGEASPQYSQAPLIPEVPERIASLIPDVKLIYVVRDPISQMRSFYRHLRSEGRETAPTLDKGLRSNPIYLAVASYGFQVSTYLRHFSPSQLMIVENGELRDRRIETLNSIFDFIEVEADSVSERSVSVELNTKSDKEVLPDYLSLPRRAWSSASKVTRKIPRKWRHGVRKALSRPVPEGAFEITDLTREWLQSKLEADLHALARHSDGRLDAAARQWIANLHGR